MPIRNNYSRLSGHHPPSVLLQRLPRSFPTGWKPKWALWAASTSSSTSGSVWTKQDEGSVALETMLRGICEKENFLDLLENFILFDHSGGRTAKILARNHQYLGVNEAVKAYEARKLKDGTSGRVLAHPGQRQKLFHGVPCPEDPPEVCRIPHHCGPHRPGGAEQAD